MDIQFDRQKFVELLLFVSDRCLTDPGFGATKLNKILYFADFLAFERLGQPITGAEYFKLPNGPAPRALLPIRQELIVSRELALKERPIVDHVQERTVALRAPDLSVFSAAEIALVDAVIEEFTGASAAEVVAESHKRSVGWLLVGEQETIPYATALIEPPGDLSSEDYRRGDEIARTLGWDVA